MLFRTPLLLVLSASLAHDRAFSEQTACVVI
jgi:hypothetical protein